MKTGALIVASLSFDSENRSNEEMTTFLPMQHLEGTTIIKREIALLRKAGITPIIVLCGYQANVLKNHLSHNGVIFCEDKQFKEHDFEDTLKTGLVFAAEMCDRVVVVPVEYPVFSGKTVDKLAEHEKNAMPVYQGEAGWPRLYVLKEEKRKRETGDAPDPGRKEEQTMMQLEVEDAGILYTLTRTDGFERVQSYAREQREANVLQMKLKIVLTKEEDFFGPGTYQLLRYIDEAGSIQAAAARMNMSYTKCWKMVNKVEEQMGFKFVERINGGKHGGSSTLTEDAQAFLNRYRALTEDIDRMGRNFFDVYFREFQ